MVRYTCKFINVFKLAKRHTRLVLSVIKKNNAKPLKYMYDMIYYSENIDFSLIILLRGLIYWEMLCISKNTLNY